MRHELPENLLKKIPRRLRKIPSERKPSIEYGHTGEVQIFETFSQNNFKKATNASNSSHGPGFMIRLALRFWYGKCREHRI